MRSLLVLTGSLVFSAAILATPAFAEEEAPASTPANEDATGADKTGAPPSAPVAPPIEPSTAPTPSAAPATAPSDEAAITAVGIERLKPSAFPGQTRGIKGGSLALTFHGLQWPYMRSPSGGSRFILGVSGWVWDDLSYGKFKAGDTNTNKKDIDRKKAINQGRFLLRVTPTWTLGDWFVQGQGEFVATTNQAATRNDTGGADTDDLYLRVGQWNLFDLTVGRFEGWEVFHLGMGMDLNTYEREGAYDSNYRVDFYGLTDMQYRSQTAGNVALHLYPMDILRFELLGQAGSTTGQNSFGGRAVGIFDLGWFKLKGGAEYRKQTDMKASNPGYGISKGFGFSAQFVLNPWIECGLNFAQGSVNTYDSKGQHDFKGSFDRVSYGGFINASPLEDVVLGFGVVNSTKRDLYKEAGNVDPDANDEFSHLQTFTALQYAIFKQLYVKVVGSYAKAKASIPLARDATKSDDKQIKTKDVDVSAYSVRVRFSYFF